MEFDISRVYTMLTADEVKEGSEGYFADNFKDLKDIIAREFSECYGKISKIKAEGYSLRFLKEDSYCFGLFYLIKESKEEKFRPYSNPDEMIEDFKKRYNSYGGWSGKENPMYNPMIWIKSKITGFRHLVTDYSDDNCGHCNKICIWVGTLPIKFKELYENYTYLDGTPCGIKEEENEND